MPYSFANESRPQLIGTSSEENSLIDILLGTLRLVTQDVITVRSKITIEIEIEIKIVVSFL